MSSVQPYLLLAQNIKITTKDCIPGTFHGVLNESLFCFFVILKKLRERPVLWRLKSISLIHSTEIKAQLQMKSGSWIPGLSWICHRMILPTCRLGWCHWLMSSSPWNSISVSVRDVQDAVYYTRIGVLLHELPRVNFLLRFPRAICL